MIGEQAQAEARLEICPHLRVAWWKYSIQSVPFSSTPYGQRGLLARVTSRETPEYMAEAAGADSS